MPLATPLLRKPPFHLLLTALLTALVAPAVPALTSSPAEATSHCTATSTAAYDVTVCLDPVAAGTGDVPLTATVDVVAKPGVPSVPGVSKVIFSYRDEYLLSDHYPDADGRTFRMVWRTTRLVDGPGALEVKARLADDVVAKHTVPVTLANGVTTPPVNTSQFQVRTGTTPAPGARFRLAAVGDTASGATVEEQLADQISSWQPNLLAYLGDVYERGSAFEFDNWYGVVGGSGPRAFGRFRDITNPTVGNHEYLTPNAAGYFDYWDNVPHYYSYDVAGWHVASIDTSVEYDQLRPGTAQYEWLAADLGANRARCTIVYMHHPRYSVAQGGGRTGLSAVWELLADRRVTLAVAGHAHHYERWLPLDRTGSPSDRGVTQLVAGAGGHELAAPVTTDSRLATTLTETGALRLDLGTDDVQFAYVGLDGAVRDSGTIGCKSTGDTLPPTTPTGLFVSPTSTTAATLSWNPSTDQYSAVAGYTVRRNGVVVAKVGAGTTSFADSGLVSGQTYSWTVDAFDTSDNYSPQSAPAATTMPSLSTRQVSSRALLRGLVVRKENGRGYQRSKFRTWVDGDGDGCDTRSEVLLADAKKPPTLLPVCRMTGGRWFSPLDGRATTKRSRIGIEHAVPLAEAWQSGARNWRKATRTRFANDLAYRPTLDVATDRVLSARGSAEPQRWLPPRAAARCSYVAEWVAVKWRWRLTVDRAEKRFLQRRLRACDWPQVLAPLRARR